MTIYMDNSATTEHYGSLDNDWGNPSSPHAFGKAAREKVEKARNDIANFIGCESEEIIFTSGGTEANNFALFGLAKANPGKKHVIVSAIEHKSILAVCDVLKKEGYSIDYIGVDSEGNVDPSDVEKRIREDTLVVSVMHANNEIGVIQRIKEISEICKKKQVYFHTDAVQTFKKLDTNVNDLGVDLMTVSGHKVHAPKGIGFLYVKLGTRIKPLLYGGDQEFRLRGGTENTAGIVVLSCILLKDLKKGEIQKIRDYIIEELKDIKGTKINGSMHHRLYNNINVSFFGIEGGALVESLSQDGIYVSTGSACTTKELSASHVLSAMGVSDNYIHGSIRISLGCDNTIDEATTVIESIKKHVASLREMSPYNMEDIE